MIQTQSQWATLLFLVIFLGGGWIALSREEVSESASAIILTEAPIVGYLAPDFTLQTPLGETIVLSDITAGAQGQPIVLNFWASWCGPCRIEMPDLQQTSMKYNGRVAVLGINQGENNQAITQFGTEFNVTYPLLNDQNQEVNSTYQINSLPTTIFIDANGIVREVQIGIITKAVLEDRIEQLIAEAE
ncbi:MAG: TlpA disulfide reductase family protein [Chloroflexota bacterium]